MLTPAHRRRPLARAAESGQAIVEFVFVLPFMLMLLFGIVELGTAVNNASDLNQVAAQTARRLAVNADSGFDPVAYAKAASEPPNPGMTVEISLPGGATPSADAAVCVKLSVDRKIDLIPGIIGPKKSLSGKAAMRLETPAAWSGSSGATGTSTAC